MVIKTGTQPDGVSEEQPNLIARCPAAVNFIESVKSRIGDYQLFPGEKFKLVSAAVLSSTNIDKHGDSFELEDLKRTVERVGSSPLWLRREHDPLIQPIGRMIAARLFSDAALGVYFVVGVMGLYDSGSLAKFSDFDIDVSTLSPTAPEELQNQQPDAVATIEFNPDEGTSDVVHQILRDAPSFVSREPVEEFRKSAELLRTVNFWVSIILLTSNPFTKKFLERWGDKAADASFEFFKWFGTAVLSLRKLDRLVIKTEYKGCAIQFVLAHDESPDVVSHQINEIHQATDSACRLVEALEKLAPECVTFSYDLEAQTWFPLYAITRKAGIIADRPRLIAIDKLQGGLSLGGKRARLP